MMMTKRALSSRLHISGYLCSLRFIACWRAIPFSWFSSTEFRRNGDQTLELQWLTVLANPNATMSRVKVLTEPLPCCTLRGGAQTSGRPQFERRRSKSTRNKWVSILVALLEGVAIITPTWPVYSRSTGRRNSRCRRSGGPTMFVCTAARAFAAAHAQV